MKFLFTFKLHAIFPLMQYTETLLVVIRGGGVKATINFFLSMTCVVSNGYRFMPLLWLMPLLLHENLLSWEKTCRIKSSFEIDFFSLRIKLLLLFILHLKSNLLPRIFHTPKKLLSSARWSLASFIFLSTNYWSFFFFLLFKKYSTFNTPTLPNLIFICFPIFFFKRPIFFLETFILKESEFCSCSFCARIKRALLIFFEAKYKSSSNSSSWKEIYSCEENFFFASWDSSFRKKIF